jgi:hypothetical protein
MRVTSAAVVHSAALLLALAGSGHALGAGPFGASLSLSALNGADGFIANGIDAQDQCGNAVSSAGDINGDGIDDLIIAARYGDPGGQSFAGEVYVVFGRDTATQGNFAPAIDLATLNGTNGFVLTGIDASDVAGRSVCGGGDVNGDGVDDLVIGAIFGDPYGLSSAGEVYVVYGKNTSVTGPFAPSMSFSSLNGDNGFTLTGIDAGDRAGASVARAGDVDGDGVDDLVIGADSADPNGQSTAGEVYVVFGKDTSTEGDFESVISLSTLNGASGFVINGIDANDRAGAAVAGAGDVNGDGISDIILGATQADPNGQSAAGEAYVVFGKNTAVEGAFPATLNLSALDGSNGFLLNGIDANDEAGWSVGSAGDFNGDGIGDVIVGAPRADPGGRSLAGEAYVVFGKDTDVAGQFAPAINLSALNGANGLVLNGIDSGDFSGISVGTPGDIDGDGVDDLIIGGWYGDPSGQSNAGEVYVVYGRHTATEGAFAASRELSTLDGTIGFVINGINAGDQTGGAVTGAGDVNGDGIDDLIVGVSYGDPNGQDGAGESAVVLGRLGQVWTSPSGGLWDTGAKWLSGEAPARGDVEISTAVGVSVTGPANPVFLRRIRLGAGIGRTTLNLAPNSYVEIEQGLDIPSSAGLGGSGVLVADAGIVNNGVVAPTDLVVLSAAGISNSGDIRLISAGPAPASLSVYGTLTTEPGASVTVFGVAALAADAIINEGDADISFAFVSIDGPVANAGIPNGPGFDPLGTITISGGSSVLFESDLVNQSEIVVTTDSSVVILGALSGNGISGPGGGPGGTVFAKGGFDPGFLLQTVVAAFGGDLTLDSTTLTTIEIGGATPGTTHDQIAALGAIGAAGTLQVNLINGYVPVPGDEYAILDAASITGSFASIILDPALVNAGADTSTLYTDGTIRIPAPTCAGDINNDGFTNAADFVILAGDFGSAVTPNTGGDLNGDGLVNASDFVILAGDFGCGS